MAVTTSRDNAGLTGNALRDAIIQLNKLFTDVSAIRTAFVATLAKLDADAGVTDTNYAALETPAAITASQIGDETGTAITA